MGFYGYPSEWKRAVIGYPVFRTERRKVMREYEVILRLLLAVFVGGLIGYEREYKHMPAGFRTHILVCIGAAVTSIIQMYAIDETSVMIMQHPELSVAIKTDIGRLGAQVITGVGFLGAGTIIHEKGSVKGLTTAASIWAVACIGLAVGLGYYFLSISAAILVFLVLVSLKKVERKFFQRKNLSFLRIEFAYKQEAVKKVADYFKTNNIKVKHVEFIIDEDKNEEELYLTREYTVLIPRILQVEEVVAQLSLIDGIDRIELI